MSGSTTDQTSARLLGTAAIVLVVLITVVHFLTDAHDVAFHNVYRRLNYIPIVMGAFAYGLRGGIGFGLFASLAYIPHAFFAMHVDPAPAVDKLLEMVLYLAVGALTGWLVEKQRQAQRRLENSLAERDALETQLVRAGKLSALGELTAGLAHEIRNPLASISGSADAIAQQFSEENEAYPMMTVLLREIRRLDRVVDEFLEFARPTSSTRELIDLREISDEVVALARKQALSLGIEIGVSGEPLVANADRDHIKQVVLNLLLNAIDSCAESTDPQMCVHTARRSIGGRRYHCVEVTDNGPGVSEEDRERIFDPYYTTREGGTGLGLSISNRIMDAHDGFLEVESAADGDTTFAACFPEVS